MPNVHFVGEITFVVSNLSATSITWAVVPQNDCWVVKRGVDYGESQVACTGAASGQAIISHPIDIHYETTAFEGWPLFIFEIWDRGFEDMKGFRGCGCVWLPSTPGHHILDCHAYMPLSEGLGALKEIFLPAYPDLKAIRELSVSPYLRSQFKCEEAGLVRLSVFTLSNGFEQHGVQLTDRSRILL